jgi:hypothetical protein
MPSTQPWFVVLVLAGVFLASCGAKERPIDDVGMAVPTDRPEMAAAPNGECTSDPSWGSFPKPPRYQDAGDGVVDILLESFDYIDKAGQTWTARKDLRWDGASIPRSLWTVVGSPKSGCHKIPSITHDEYYKHHDEYTKTRKEVDQMFYEACRANGIGAAKAKTMYYALRWFGARWDDDDLPASTLADETDQEALVERLLRHLEQTDLELDELEAMEPSTLAAALPS